MGKPYKSEAKELGKTTSYLNKQVLFNARATTNTGTYLKTWIMVNGRWHFVGWINELGTTYVDKIITNKSVNYDMHMVSKRIGAYGKHLTFMEPKNLERQHFI